MSLTTSSELPFDLEAPFQRRPLLLKFCICIFYRYLRIVLEYRYSLRACLQPCIERSVLVLGLLFPLSSPSSLLFPIVIIAYLVPLWFNRVLGPTTPLSSIPSPSSSSQTSSPSLPSSSSPPSSYHWMITIRWYSPRQLGSTQEGASFLLEVARCAGSVLLEAIMSSIMVMALNQKWWWCWRRWTNREIFEEQIAPVILDIEQQPKDQDKKHSTDEIRYFILYECEIVPQISSLSNT